MKQANTTAGSTWTVTSPNGCTVTDNSGLTLGTVEAGQQKVFVATGNKLMVDDDSARITATFKYAPAKLMALGLLGGGNSELPAGYLRADFLESTGTQLVQLPEVPMAPDANDVLNYGLKSETQLTSDANYRAPLGCVMSNSKNGILALGTAGTGKVQIMLGKQRITFENELLRNSRVETILNWFNDGKYCVKSALTTYSGALQKAEVDKAEIWYVFLRLFDKGTKTDDSPSSCRIWSAQISYYENIIHDLSPAIDSTGIPCMFDKVSKRTFKNSGTGSFIVGMTLAQARKLGKLPDSGGALTISLPANYTDDEGVLEALATVESKGWVLTVQTYEADTSEASTFGMPRIWVRRTQDENGTYVDTAGTRWQVDWCVDMLTPDGSTPDQHGYELFRSVDVAVSYWELEPYVDPAEEEEFLTNSEL